MRKFARVWLTTLVLLFVGSVPALAMDCARLAALALPNTTITEAELVAAGAFDGPAPPFGPPPAVVAAIYKAMPAFCRINATLAPTSDSDIKIEVWMPAQNWNGKLDGIGNGCGPGRSVISRWPNR